MEILALKNVSFAYPSGDTALSDINFSVNRGELVALCGATGSGKSTLLSLLKPMLDPKGERTGDISFFNKPLDEYSAKESARRIGYVAQDPEAQIVTDKVWHELSFALENLGEKREAIRRKTAEAASFFGIDEWYEKDTHSLSGGQKQILNLAAVMTLEPDLLLLDEPMSQLDPISAKLFLSAVLRLRDETGVSIIIAEHRLEDIIPVCDKVLFLGKGKALAFDTPQGIIRSFRSDEDIMTYMPISARIFNALGCKGEAPLSVGQGRAYIENNFSNHISALSYEKPVHSKETALSFKNVFFRYEKDSSDILRGLSLDIHEGEIFCILGANAAGKTTALSCAAGALRPYSGKIEVFGKKLKDYKNGTLYSEALAYLPQEVKTLFLKQSVREELEQLGSKHRFEWDELLDMHPYDLSGGEAELLALEKVLSRDPKLLLLDEPTKGLDPISKKTLRDILKKLRTDGVTIVCVTHDVEFCAMCADRCALMFRGEALCEDDTRSFFSSGSFYTTAARRLTKSYYENAVTEQDAVELCRKNGGRAT